MIPIAPQDAGQWAHALFSQAKLGDKRRTNRLVDIAHRAGQYSGKSAAFACEGDTALVEGTYRFIRNEQVSAFAIRSAGFDTTAAKAVQCEEVWVLEDTTSLSYKHQVAKALGKLGKPSDKARGWWVHSDLMVDGQSLQTLGLVHQEWWSRPDDAADADEKESGKWQAACESMRRRFGQQMSKVITVCDREADIFSYMEDKYRHGERFVVRGKHLRKVEGDEDILSHVRSQGVLGGYQLYIPQKGWKDKQGKPRNRPARLAKLQVQSAQVTLTHRGVPLEVNVVLAQETVTTGKETPLRWMLLTTEPVETLAQALKVIGIYATRWRVEDFHKAWKTGAGAERQRMTAPEHLERMVSILAFVGVRLMQLRESLTLANTLQAQGMVEQAKQVASLTCDTVLSKDEWQLLWQIDKVNKRKSKTGGPVPSLQWAYQAIATLGGFTDTKRTGIASWATLWAGWSIFQERLSGYLTTREMMKEGFDFDD